MTYVSLKDNRLVLHLSDMHDELDLSEEEAISAYELLTSLRDKRESQSPLRELSH
jgi:hypothetical protein